MVQYNKAQLGQAAKELGLFDESEYDLFRKCIVFYASISAQEINKTFDTSAIDRLTFYIIRRDLFPVLRKKEKFDLETRKKEAKEFIGQLMHLTVEEKEYLELFEAKEYKPELLFSDDRILKDSEYNSGRNHFAAETPTNILAKDWINKLKTLSSDSFDPLA